MKESGIQLRIDLPYGEIEGFGINGKVYNILNRSRNTDLIPRGASPFQIHTQYVAKGSDNRLYEVYVYYYVSFEGVRYAVIDSIRSA